MSQKKEFVDWAGQSWLINLIRSVLGQMWYGERSIHIHSSTTLKMIYLSTFHHCELFISYNLKK